MVVMDVAMEFELNKSCCNISSVAMEFDVLTNLLL